MLFNFKVFMLFLIALCNVSLAQTPPNEDLYYHNGLTWSKTTSVTTNLAQAKEYCSQRNYNDLGAENWRLPSYSEIVPFWTDTFMRNQEGLKTAWNMLMQGGWDASAQLGRNFLLIALNDNGKKIAMVTEKNMGILHRHDPNGALSSLCVTTRQNPTYRPAEIVRSQFLIMRGNGVFDYFVQCRGSIYGATFSNDPRTNVVTGGLNGGKSARYELSFNIGDNELDWDQYVGGKYCQGIYH